MTDELSLFRLSPRPCGHVHSRARDLYRCLIENGVPGFDISLDPFAPLSGVQG